MRSDEELTIEKLAEFVAKSKRLNNMRYIPLAKTYESDFEILHRPRKPKYKPDNRLVVNFAKYVVDTFNGFFIGNPIKTTCDEEELANTVEFIQKYNDQDDNNAELSKKMSIFGRAYEMYFVDENKQIGITYLDPTEAFMIYDDSITENPLYFVHFYKDANDVERGSVSDNRTIRYFSSENGPIKWTGEEVAHNFDGVPATEFIENEERIGLYEPVITLINEYSKGISEKSNDVDYFADAYMKVLGAKLNKEDLKDLRNQRIINLESGMDDNIQVDFMQKPNADDTQEHLLDRIERLIFLITMVPNVFDESFGTSSGIAMQYKLFGTRNMFTSKSRKFESGMNRRWKIIFSNPLVKANEDDWVKLRYKFTPNIPANTSEEAQTASQLSGIVSQRTQLETLSIVDNVQDELNRIKEENEEKALDLYDERLFDSSESNQEEQNSEDHE
jgi:SPP1 family phage portal protein